MRLSKNTRPVDHRIVIAHLVAFGLLAGLFQGPALALPTATSPNVDSATARVEPSGSSPRVLPIVPRALTGAALKSVARLVVQEVDRDLLAAEDAIRDAAGEPMRFAVPHPVLVNPDTHGTWEPLGEDLMLWRLRVQAPGASSLNLAFTDFFLPPGGRLLIYAADESFHLRPFTESDHQDHGELWTPIIPSDEVVVELTLPEAERGQVDLQLTSVNYGYRAFGAETGQKSGSCNVDVTCPEGNNWLGQIRSVARIVIGGGVLCTGAMINNTAQDLRPYFLSAFHCGIDSGNDSSVVFYWNYENSPCRPPGSAASGQPGNGSLNRFQTGSTYRAGFDPSDFVLVELNSAPNPSWNVFWAGWDRGPGNPGSAVAIHHPSGDEKRISFENDALTTTSYLSNSSPGAGTHLRVADWDVGTTEGGSSGSPLFNAQKRIVGQLEGGFAACGNNDPDWYGRLSVSWNGGGGSTTRLSNWLAPGTPGTTTLNGRGQNQATPPSAPSNLTATTQSTTEVRLDWRDNSGDEADFQIQLSTDGTNFTSIGTVPEDSVAALVTDLAPGTSYSFRVRARNASGNSAFSNVATATTAANAPVAPTQITAQALSTSQIRVSWEDSSSNETDFQIQISLDGVSFSNAGTASADATSFVATGLQRLTEYFFRVRARGSSGNSPFSAIASATTNDNPGTCTADTFTHCLNGGRFRVTATFDTTANPPDDARAQGLTGDTGYFWFFNEENVEVVVKVLQGCGFNNRYWVFAAGLTNVLTKITVVDTSNGAAQTYTNPQETAFEPILDTRAFATCP